MFISLLIIVTGSYAQDIDSTIYAKSTFDVQMLGNKGFGSIGYNRAIYQKHNFNLLISPSIGYVPSSREDTAHSIPRFLHLNLGVNVTYQLIYNEISAGISYTKILLGDPYHVKPKSNYDRILGDLAYIRHFKHDGLALKFSYTPFLYDSGANDVESFPWGITIRMALK